MAKGMTYAQLADELGVETQVVIDWENGLYAPDTDFCEKISAFFGMSIENIDVEKLQKEKALKESVRANKKMFTVFSILGSLFVGIGVTVILVALWDRFPGVVKTIVSFLPLIASQCGVVYTYKKKFNNVAWREGASILWSLGVTATVGLVSMVLGLHFGVGACLLIDALLILPILFTFDVISPLGFYYGYTFCGIVSLGDDYGYSDATVVLVMLAFVAAGVLFRFFSRKSLTGKRDTFVSVVTIIASCNALLILAAVLGWGHLSVLGAVAVLLCVVNKPDKKLLNNIGYVGSALFSILITESLLSEEVYPFDAGIGAISKPEYLVVALTGVALIGYSFFVLSKNHNKPIQKILYCALGASVSVIGLLNPVINAPIVLGLVAFAFAFVQGVVAIVTGINKKNYLVLNIGLIEIFILMFFVLSAYDWDMIVTGFMFLIAGVSFFGANFYISRKIQKEQRQLAGEVVSDEE